MYTNLDAWWLITVGKVLQSVNIIIVGDQLMCFALCDSSVDKQTKNESKFKMRAHAISSYSVLQNGRKNHWRMPHNTNYVESICVGFLLCFSPFLLCLGQFKQANINSLWVIVVGGQNQKQHGKKHFSRLDYDTEYFLFLINEFIVSKARRFITPDMHVLVMYWHADYGSCFTVLTVCENYNNYLDNLCVYVSQVQSGRIHANTFAQ